MDFGPQRENKIRLANYIHDRYGIMVNPDAIFEAHIKRIHEYKRQLLQVFHVITRYNGM
jgi:starch phosphorylase